MGILHFWESTRPLLPKYQPDCNITCTQYFQASMLKTILLLLSHGQSFLITAHWEHFHSNANVIVLILWPRVHESPIQVHFSMQALTRLFCSLLLWKVTLKPFKVILKVAVGLHVLIPLSFLVSQDPGRGVKLKYYTCLLGTSCSQQLQ